MNREGPKRASGSLDVFAREGSHSVSEGLTSQQHLDFSLAVLRDISMHKKLPGRH